MTPSKAVKNAVMIASLIEFQARPVNRRVAQNTRLPTINPDITFSDPMYQAQVAQAVIARLEHQGAPGQQDQRSVAISI